jgi:hypothetical protein
MIRLVLAGLAGLALAAGALAAPPPSTPPTRVIIPSTPTPVTYPSRPIAPVIVVPTTPGPRLFVPPPTPPVHRQYTLCYRSGLFGPWSYYGAYRHFWYAEEIGLALEQYR